MYIELLLWKLEVYREISPRSPLDLIKGKLYKREVEKRKCYLFQGLLLTLTTILLTINVTINLLHTPIYCIYIGNPLTSTNFAICSGDCISRSLHHVGNFVPRKHIVVDNLRTCMMHA